jgi:hypothetical protein
MVCCHDAGANCFVTKVLGEVFTRFHAVFIKCHSSMQNSLFDLQGRIHCGLMSKKIKSVLLDFVIHLSHLFWSR